MQMQNKVALITGGSSGIGRAAALLFVKEGAKVIIAARRAAQGNQLLEDIEQLGGEASFIQTDVSKSSEIEALIQQTVERYGRLDYAFNNAGTEGVFAPITELNEADWEQTITTNLKAVWLCLKYEIAQMLEQKSGGAIVNTSSWLAKGGSVGSTIYSASKAGIDGMVRPAALEYAGQGIRINNINPGIIDTEMFRRFFSPEDEAAKPFLDHIPAQRFGTPEEVAKVAVWLCSDAASYVTGQTISVDAGYTIPGHR